MKMKKIIPALMAIALLAGCNNTSGNTNTATDTTPTSSDTSTTTEPEVKKYKIAVTCPTAIEYELSDEYQEPGKSVSLKITKIADGFSIEEITVNNKAYTLDGNNSISFVMPNRSVNIIIKCNVTGDVTLKGDVIGVLTDDDNDGVYVAKGVKVTSSAARVYFSYNVGSTVLSSMELDEYRCFADITFTGAHSDYTFSIASGCTYDFYYEPAAQYSCYVIRTSVDVLPSDASTLDSLFDGSMRSESTSNSVNVGLNHIDYYIKDLQDTNNLLWNNFTWDLYENNSSLAVVKDTVNSDKFGNPREYYVYKEADFDKGVYSVVDTFNKSYGNDDRTRDEYNNFGAYSAQFDIVSLDSDNNTRFERSVREATHAINSSAHMDYYLERDFMYSYRVGFEADELSWSKIDIVSTPETDGFKVEIDSIAEYDSEEGTYTVKRHEAIIYDVELHFTTAGAVKSIEYLQSQYKQADWNFTSHSPMTGAQDNFQKAMTIECTYGPKKAGSANFDKSPYFITSFDKMHFFNDDLKDKYTDDGVTNYLHYNDKVRVSTSDNYDKLEDLDIIYSPSTALDGWQYAPTSSDNEAVITKQASDLYYEMTCIDVGSANVTFTNHTQNSGISHTENINVVATKKYHSLYIYHYDYVQDGSSPVTSATSASIVAGTIAEFNVGCVSSSAPVIYDAVPYVKGEEPVYKTGYAGIVETRMKVLQTGKRLILDCSGFADIEKAVMVTVRLSSDVWFEDYFVENHTNFEDLEMTITPASVNPTGTWLCDMATAEEKLDGIEDYVKVEFLNEDYGTSGEKKGILTDHLCIPSENIEYTYTFIFSWTYERGYINASVHSHNVDGSDNLTFDLSFGFLSDYSTWGVCLRYAEYDADAEEWYTDVFDSIGMVDADGDVNGYLKLIKQ